MLIDWQSQFLNISWDQFRTHAFTLSQKIKKSGKSFDLIVAIARGGLTLSQLLSDYLTLPIAAFTVQSYKDLKQSSIPHIIYGLDGQLAGKKILLVDDVSDTGKTFLRGIAYLEELGVTRTNISTCAMHHKPHSSYFPDFYLTSTPTWIIYPYEAGETMHTLSQKWKKEGVPPKEIKKRFLELKFGTKHIETFLLK